MLVITYTLIGFRLFCLKGYGKTLHFVGFCKRNEKKNILLGFLLIT